MSCALSDLFEIRNGHSLELNALELSDCLNGIAFVSRQINGEQWHFRLR